MGFDSRPVKFIKARTCRLPCIYCGETIWVDQMYIDGVGGSNVNPTGNAHKDCYLAPPTRKEVT